MKESYQGLQILHCNLHFEQNLIQSIYYLHIKDESFINPIARNDKIGWYETFTKHVIMSKLPTNTKLMLIGDSAIASFDKCSNIFDHLFFFFSTLNIVISRDKIDRHHLKKNQICPIKKRQ